MFFVLMKYIKNKKIIYFISLDISPLDFRVFILPNIGFIIVSFFPFFINGEYQEMSHIYAIFTNFGI